MRSAILDGFYGVDVIRVGPVETLVHSQTLRGHREWVTHGRLSPEPCGACLGTGRVTSAACARCDGEGHSPHEVRTSIGDWSEQMLFRAPFGPPATYHMCAECCWPRSQCECG